MKNQSPGALVISLDFELLWGVFDVIDYTKCENYFENTRKIIPEILGLFEKNEIHSTWATVGMLFNENWEEWESNIPDNIPNYNNPALSAYEFGNKYRLTGKPDWCFAPDLIKAISSFPGQELGTHTYSHYYCEEPGQKTINFKEDLQRAIILAKNFNVSLKSLVFPRNQIREDYLKICDELGIINVRSNPGSWYWHNARSNALSTRLARTGDAYIAMGKKSYSQKDLRKYNGLPVKQKASRFLRPVETNKILRKLKMNRILNEMEYAAANNEIYHLWWHPHNFGDHPLESVRDLQIILKHYKELKEKFNYQSFNMFEAGEEAS